jgi:hypothetical protein
VLLLLLLFSVTTTTTLEENTCVCVESSKVSRERKRDFNKLVVVVILGPCVIIDDHDSFSSLSTLHRSYISILYIYMGSIDR